MQYIQDIKSKTDKDISILIEETSSTPNFTIIESPGGFIETKENTKNGSKNLIQICKNHNINYITLDFSNNGTKKEQPVNELRFSNRIKDMQSVVDYAIEKYKSEIILLGSSLGGFITLNTANYSDKIKSLILNCTAVKAHLCVESGIPVNEFKKWKEQNIAIVWGVPFTYDFYQDLVNLNAIIVIPDIKKPILWFHGTDDTVVPISQAYEAKNYNPNIELIEIQGGGHRFGDKMKSGEWEEKIEKFIKNMQG